MPRPIPAAFALFFSLTLAGCEGCNSDPKNAPSAQTTASAPSAAAMPAPSPSAAAGNPELAKLFSGPPDDPSRPYLPLKLGEMESGITAALPEGWTGGEEYGDDLVMAGPDTEAVVIFRREMLSGPAGQQLTAEQTPVTVRNGMAFAAKVRQIEWEAPVSGTLGEKQWPAFIWRGKGSFVGGGQIAWNVYALSAPISEDTKINIIGTWNSARPTLEKAVVSAMKSVRR